MKQMESNMFIEKIAQKDKPFVKLVGEDGNAFSIMGRVRGAWHSSDVEEREQIIHEYTERATLGSYDHLLRVTREYINEDEIEE